MCILAIRLNNDENRRPNLKDRKYAERMHGDVSTIHCPSMMLNIDLRKFIPAEFIVSQLIYAAPLKDTTHVLFQDTPSAFTFALQIYANGNI